MQSIYKGVLMVRRYFKQGLNFNLHKHVIFQVVGSRFAWATRNVHITALNDSTYVGMSLYNVVLLSTTTAVVGYFLQDQHERSYILTSVFILLCVTITLCLVFVPKVREVAQDPHSTAKPQRAVISNIPAKAVIDEKRFIINHHRQQLILKLQRLTNQNDMLRFNAMKVCVTTASLFGFFSIRIFTF